MVNIKLICVGGLKERFWVEACNEYGKRLSAVARAEVREVREKRLPENPSDAQINAALAAEASDIAAIIPKQAYVCAMCVEGQALESAALAEKLSCEMLSHSTFVFIVGGSFGLHDLVKQRADFRLSMSKMTFPHHLARVMLLEQIYRAFTIMSNGRYNK